MMIIWSVPVDAEGTGMRLLGTIRVSDARVCQGGPGTHDEDALLDGGQEAKGLLFDW